jgi:hypothetical protein
MTSQWFADTTPEALEVYIGLHRAMSPSQRLARVFELGQIQQALQFTNVRANYPEAGAEEVFFRVAARRLGRDLMIRAYNWDPDLHP